LHGDRAAFLATVDPQRPAFARREAAVFDALRQVPFASWHYELDPERERATTPALDARYGTWWSPDVTLRYAIAGFDRTATQQQQGLTFVSRAGRWYLAADDDFADHPTAHDLWDGGPVLVRRGRSCLVLSHPKGRRLAGLVERECEAAVPRVTAVWGRAWSQRVVLLVPDSTKELADVVPDAGDLSNIAAVATAELLEPGTGYHPVGDRVVVNPATFTQLGPLGRRVVLTHEVTHVASRAATGDQLPTWMVEGIADYVGYLDVDVPLAVAAEELRRQVRRGRLPQELPIDSDFDGGRSDLAQTYEESWLAVSLLAHRYGRPRLLALYRHIGADPSSGAVERAFEADLGTSVDAFTAAWLADLRRRLA
ncbi:MAG: hypothetical protein WCD35_12835, partial [Mycobacteriales bacterium]